MHGLNDGLEEFRLLAKFIKEAHPGTTVLFLDDHQYRASAKNLWRQIKDFRSDLEDCLARNDTKDGAHLLCFSQGGVACRALLSVMPNHNIHTFIALSSPLAGQYGVTDRLLKFISKPWREFVHKVCYWVLGQQISFCEYWNDPHQREKYLKHSDFLALINGDKHHKDLETWKENFLKIKKLVLIGGPDDGVITPWQSSHFGFYNSKEIVKGMKKQPFYRKDSFGLKTLDARGDIAVCEQSGVKHTHWHNNQSVFTNCIQDWLI